MLFPGVGSVVVELMVTEPEITVLPAVAAFTFTTRVKVRLARLVPVARLLPSVQVTFPVPLTAGFVQVHPAGGATDWNVVLAGVACTHWGTAAVFGPLFLTTMV